MAYNRKRITVPEWGFSEVTCDGCGVSLEIGSPHSVVDGVWDVLSPKNSLIVRLEGGYDQYFDDLSKSDEDVTFLFCHGCSDKLLETFPAFKRILK